MDTGFRLKRERYVVSWGKEGRLVFNFLKWDNDFFKVPAYLLDSEMSNPVDLGNYYDDIRNKMKVSLPQGFITAKIPHDWDISAPSLFQDCDFKFILTELVLKYSTSENIPPVKNDINDIKIEQITSKNHADFSNLGKYLILSRFHQDRLIEKGKADLLWRNFLKNFKISENENAVIVAKRNDKVVGCVIIEFQNINKKRYANFFIVSVDEVFRGLGIGTRLMEYGIAYCKNKSDVIIVETQFNNIPAINFYLKNGFTTMHQTRAIFHRWALSTVS